jgi:hypothetical protein
MTTTITMTVTGLPADAGGGSGYEIRVAGHLGDTIRTAFPELRACPQGRDTVLSGTLPDQAALYGVLYQLEALGLELIELRRYPSK